MAQSGKNIQTRGLAGQLPTRGYAKVHHPIALDNLKELRAAILNFERNAEDLPHFVSVVQLYISDASETDLAVVGGILGTSADGVKKWARGISCPQPSGRSIIVEWISNKSP